MNGCETTLKPTQSCEITLTFEGENQATLHLGDNSYTSLPISMSVDVKNDGDGDLDSNSGDNNTNGGGDNATGGSSGGSMGFWSLLLFGVLYLRRQK